MGIQGGILMKSNNVDFEQHTELDGCHKSTFLVFFLPKKLFELWFKGGTSACVSSSDTKLNLPGSRFHFSFPIFNIL